MRRRRAKSHRSGNTVAMKGRKSIKAGRSWSWSRPHSPRKEAWVWHGGVDTGPAVAILSNAGNRKRQK